MKEVREIIIFGLISLFLLVGPWHMIIDSILLESIFFIGIGMLLTVSIYSVEFKKNVRLKKNN